MANTVEYRGHIGSVEYSPEDKCFFGKLEMIDDLVTFEANRADDLEINFQKAVNEYIQTCKELERKPQKIYKGISNVRIDPKLYKKLCKRAIKEGISLNSLIQRTLLRQVG